MQEKRNADAAAPASVIGDGGVEDWKTRVPAEYRLHLPLHSDGRGSDDFLVQGLPTVATKEELGGGESLPFQRHATGPERGLERRLLPGSRLGVADSVADGGASVSLLLLHLRLFSGGHHRG